MPAKIHPSLPLDRLVEPADAEKWTIVATVVAFVPAIFPGGIFLMGLHEGAWRTAGADRPYSFLITIPGWVVALLALTALAFALVLTGTRSRHTAIAGTVAALAVAATAILPAFLGTTSVLNGIGFALVTLLIQGLWLLAVCVDIAAFLQDDRTPLTV